MRHEMNEDHIERIPDFFLEQYRLGEADQETAARIESDPEALHRLSRIDADNALHFERYPAGWFVEQVRRKAASETATEDGTARVGNAIHSIREFFSNHPFALPGLAAAVLVLALLPYQLLLRSDQSPDDTAAIARGERVKGLDTSLFIFRSAPDGSVEQLADGSRVAEGDHLQIAYTAAGKSHGMIFSVDGNGIVTLHYPDRPGDSSALEQGGSTALPFAYVLDNAPRYEEFFFLAASTPIESDRILAEIESNADPQAVTTLLNEWASRDETRDYQRLSLLKNGDPK